MDVKEKKPWSYTFLYSDSLSSKRLKKSEWMGFAHIFYLFIYFIPGS